MIHIKYVEIFTISILTFAKARKYNIQHISRLPDY